MSNDSDSGDFDTDSDTQMFTKMDDVEEKRDQMKMNEMAKMNVSDFESDSDTETFTKMDEVKEKMDRMKMNEMAKMDYDTDSDAEMLFTKLDEEKERMDKMKMNEMDKMEKEAAKMPPFIRPQRRTSPQIRKKIKNYNSWVRRMKYKQYKQENKQYNKEVAAQEDQEDNAR